MQAHITSREQDVINCLWQGLRRVDIAYELGITPRAVRNHLQNLQAKFGIDGVRFHPGIRLVYLIAREKGLI